MTQFATDLYQSSTTINFFSTVHDHAATLLMVSFVGILAGYLVSGMDDVFIDFVAWFKRLRPRKLSGSDLDKMDHHPEKMLAIIVPAWDEGEIISRMILGNLGRIEYQNVHFFVGCYPNDPETVIAVRALEDTHAQVHAVVNFKDGPTSKGQILNWVIDSILDWERQSGLEFDAFLMHDSEDLIHPKSLKLINVSLDQSDFIQIPVFSLARSPWAIVAGIYIDEFAESHTKDMLVRSYLGGGVPSAGVGTCMSRDFVLGHKLQNEGRLFNDGCLTEDYELGMLAGIQGARQEFLATYFVDPLTGRSEFIATREYFPKAFKRSVRQKCRWTLGIALQSWRSIRWRGTCAQRYFLFRDRKGLITNPLMVIGYLWIGLLFFWIHFAPDVVTNLQGSRLAFVAGLTGVFAVNRMLQRMICVARVYGLGLSLLVPLRIPVGNIINCLAVLNAVAKDSHARFTRKSLVWAKTTHELPENFGLSPPVAVVPKAMPNLAQGGS